MLVVGLRLEYMPQICLTLASTLATMQSAILLSSKTITSFKKYSRFGTSCRIWRPSSSTKTLQRNVQTFTLYVSACVTADELWTIQWNYLYSWSSYVIS